MDTDTARPMSSSVTMSRLEGINVPDLFWDLGRRQCTGVLHLTSKGITKKVYLSDGRIVFAASSDPNDRLGESLLRAGTIRLEHLEQAIARLPEGKRLGTILVEAGHLTPDQLVPGIVAQVRSIVLSLFAWSQGEFVFVEGPLPTDEVVKLDVRTPELLLQGIRGINSFSRMRASVGPQRSRYRTVEGWRDAVAGLGLREEEKQLLARLEAPGQSVERLCRDVLMSNFETYQALWAFKVLGLIELAEQRPDTEAPFAVEGRLEGDGVPGLVVRLCRAGETGVLHISSGALERTIHVKDGQCVFATSNTADDGLIAHLLRRGVISLRDQEETARRLLSNKRVGTILVERGIIDEDDLARMVREHLTEIIFDSFRWERGEWMFVPGKLPSEEGITLGRSVEDLVFEGLRRVTSWSRVREGCGGLTTRLSLTPDYLSVLDRMTIGPAEWEIVTSLRSPASALDLCRATELGDYRVCQCLWALRMLGAVQEAPLEEAVDVAFGTRYVPESIAIPETSTAAAPPEPTADERAKTEPEPEPIAPTELADSESFEVTSLVEMSPSADVADGSIAPSDWEEPDSDTPRGPQAWPAEADEITVPLSDAADGEIVSEPWRLAAERPVEAEANRAPEPIGDEPAASVENAGASDGPPHADPYGPVSDDTALVTDESPESPEMSDPVPSSSWGSGVSADPILDSPADRTLVFTRDEIERVVAPKPSDDAPEFTIDEPPSGFAGRPVQDAPTMESGETPPTAAPHETPAHDESASPVVSDPDGPTPRDNVAEIMSGAAAALEGESASEPSWAPPENLDAEIARFNARHKVVFRVIRLEVGAGAGNFVRSCRHTLSNGFGALFDGAELLPDGTWDPAVLRRLVVESRIEAPGDGYERLIEREIERLRLQIGDRRASELTEQVAQI